MHSKSKRTLLKVLSVILVATLLIGTFAVGVFAGNDSYLDDAIKDKYNSIDQVELTDEQNAAILLDLADRELAKLNMVVDIPLIGSLNMTSVDNLLSSIYSLTGNWLYGSATVGDLAVLKTYRSDIADARRSNAATSDLVVINSVLTYMTHCAPTLVKILDNTFNWGIVKSFLPKDVQAMLNDLPTFVKKSLWDVCHPVMQLSDGTYTKPVPYSGQSLDEIVQFIFNNQLGGKYEATTGLPGVLPGLDINLIESSGYTVFEQFIFASLNQFAVPAINDSLQPIIKNAVKSNMEKYPNCTLDQFINVDFKVETYKYQAGVSLEDQLNDILGSYVKQMLKKDVFTWNKGTSPDVLEDNVNRLLKEIIKRGGDQKNVSGFSIQETVTYVAHEAVQEFVKHIEMPDDLNLRQIAFIGLREFAATIIPEADYSGIDFMSDDVKNNDDAWLNIVADIGTFYMNNLIDFNYNPATDTNTADSTKFDKFMNALLMFGVRRAQGLMNTADFDNKNDTVWEKFDKVLWDVFDKEWLPEVISADGSATKNVVDYALDTIFTVDVHQLYAFFEHKDGITGLNEPAQDSLIKIVKNLINQALPGTVPADMNLTCFEDILNPVNLKVLLENFATNLETNKDTVIPPALRLVVMILGAANEQSLGEVALGVPSRIECPEGKIPDGQTIKVTNWSNGVNRGYRDANGVLHQDNTYRIKLVSATSSEANIKLGNVAGTVLNADASTDISVSGTVNENKLVKITLTYNILDEREGKTENDYINPVELTKSVYVYMFKDAGLNGVMSPESAGVKNTVIQSMPTYSFVTSLYEASTFTATMDHWFDLLTLNNGEVKVDKVTLVNGTLPVGMVVNTDHSQTKLAEVTATVNNSYAGLVPFRMDANTSDSQPYGIYPVTFNATVSDSRGSATTGNVDKTFVIYNDFGLPGLLNAAMGYNRQRDDYADDAKDEWAAYETAMSNAAALVYGNGVLSNMFATYTDGMTGAINDGEAKNAYGKAYDALEAAIVALDAKVKTTNKTALQGLEAILKLEESPEGGYFDFVDYKLYTFRRWQGWQYAAWDMINSQSGTNPPALKALDIAYTTHMLEMTYNRMVRKVASKNYLADAIADAKAETKDKSFTPESWIPFKVALNFANEVMSEPIGTPEAPQLRQSKVNAARLDLIKATNNLVEGNGLVTNTNADTKIDMSRGIIYGLKTEMQLSECESFFKPIDGYTMTVTPVAENTFVGTGSVVEIKDAYNAVVDSYYVVIFGDLDGDGKIKRDDDDIAVMEEIIDSGESSNQPLFTAADLDWNGTVNDDDLTILEDAVKGAYDISQVAPNE